MHEKEEEKRTETIEIDKVNIDDYEVKIEGLKDNVKKLKKLKKREKEIAELEKEKNNILKEINRKHKKRWYKVAEAINSLLEYLEENNITISDFSKNKKLKKLKYINDEDVKNQLSIVNEFHKCVSVYRCASSHMLPMQTGKLVEEYKKRKKYFKKYIELLKSKKDLNNFEKVIFEYSDEYLNRSEKVLKVISNSRYISIIKRSMDKYEICLGNTNFSNLRKRKNLEIASLQDCSFCNVEMDAIYLLSKLKRKNVKLDLNNLIDFYIKAEKLDDNSKKFILAMLSFPSGLINLVLDYKKGKKNFSSEENLLKLKNEIIKDNYSLI